MKEFVFPYQRSLQSQLTEDAQELLIAAGEAADKAYAPYSKFKVGAALLLTDGQIIRGANHENAAYPAGICAERAVLGIYDMQGQAKVKAIAIAYKTGNESVHPPLAPCGICRQSILETQLNQESPIAVYMGSPDGEVIMVEDSSFLLPFHFSSDYL